MNRRKLTSRFGRVFVCVCAPLDPLTQDNSNDGSNYHTRTNRHDDGSKHDCHADPQRLGENSSDSRGVLLQVRYLDVEGVWIGNESHRHEDDNQRA